ncbi:transcriptional regulator swi6 [Chytridiales sp. JEL 0842]|nr:transcriptional regulator swi6 [Chytridiales sp. JEL 0842]
MICAEDIVATPEDGMSPQPSPRISDESTPAEPAVMDEMVEYSEKTSVASSGCVSPVGKAGDNVVSAAPRELQNDGEASSETITTTSNNNASDLAPNTMASTTSSTQSAPSSSRAISSPLPPNWNVYGAVYSNVPVLEMMCKNVAIMRRRADSYLNATQILKLANVDKGKRTKILEKEINRGLFEKVQGGYGKYQGTWIPFDRGVHIAKMFNVDKLIAPILNYQMPLDGEEDNTPNKVQPNRDRQRKALAESNTSKKRDREAAESASARRSRRAAEIKSMKEESSEDDEDIGTPDDMSPTYSPRQQRKKVRMTADDYYATGGGQSENMIEKYRSTLMAIFLNDDPNYVPSFLTASTPPPGFDIDLIIDDQGHTSLHWAAALARVKVLKVLLAKKAAVKLTNYNGESALIRAVIVTNNYDNQTFDEMLNLLGEAVPIVDKKGRTLLHHMALTAGIKGRVQASRYYMDELFTWIKDHGGNFKSIINVQDKNGDTALNIAARIGNRGIVEELLSVGADPRLENVAGLKPADFGFADLVPINGLSPTVVESSPKVKTEVVEPVEKALAIAESNLPPRITEDELIGGMKGENIGKLVQRMVDDLNATFELDLQKKQEELIHAQRLLQDVTKELTEVRKQNQQLQIQNQQFPELKLKIEALERSIDNEVVKAQIREQLQIQYPDPVAASDVNGSSSVDDAMNVDTKEFAVTGMLNEAEEIVLLKAQIAAFEAQLARNAQEEENLQAELNRLKTQRGTQEILCTKIIAACCNIPPEKVTDLLAPLLTAVESDKSDIDLKAIATLISKITREA